MSKNRDVASTWAEFLEARRREGKPLRRFRWAKSDISAAWAKTYEDEEVLPPDPVETWEEAEIEFERAKKQRETAYEELEVFLDALLRNDDKGLNPEDKAWTFEKDADPAYVKIETWKEAKKPPGRQKKEVEIKPVNVFDAKKVKDELDARKTSIRQAERSKLIESYAQQARDRGEVVDDQTYKEIEFFVDNSEEHAGPEAKTSRFSKAG